jgi:hypothetical protein
MLTLIVYGHGRHAATTNIEGTPQTAVKAEITTPRAGPSNVTDRHVSMESTEHMPHPGDAMIYSNSGHVSPTNRGSLGRLHVVSVDDNVGGRVPSQYGVLETTNTASNMANDVRFGSPGPTSRGEDSPVHSPRVANIWSNDPRVVSSI